MAKWSVGSSGSAWSVTRLRRGLLALAAVVAIGTAGYMFIGGLAFHEALYMVAITLSTVGLREVPGADSLAARYWTVAVILFGVGTVFYIGGGLVAHVAEGRLREVMGRRRVTREIEKLTGHYIVCGFGRMGALICRALAERKIPFVLVESDAESAAQAGEEGMLYVLGDATEESVLEAAGVDRASGIVSGLPSDADNVFITLTARQMNPKITIVAKADQPSTHKKLEMAGVTRVISPHVIGAQRVVNLLVRPGVVDLIQVMSGSGPAQELEVDELVVTADSQLAGQSIIEADIRKRVGLIVVGLRRAGGQLAFNPDPAEKMTAGDRLIVMGRAGQVDRLRQIYGL